MKNWPRVLKYFSPDFPRIAFALALMVLSIFASVAKPWPVAIIIDSLVGGKPLPAWLPNELQTASKPALIGFLALLVFLLHALQGSFAAWQNYLSIQTGLRGLSRLRNELFARMQQLSLAFYQRSNQGDLIYRA